MRLKSRHGRQCGAVPKGMWELACIETGQSQKAVETNGETKDELKLPALVSQT